jgi:hypothetical protein
MHLPKSYRWMAQTPGSIYQISTRKEPVMNRIHLFTIARAVRLALYLATAALGFSGHVFAQVRPGDILVADAANGMVLRIDPVSGFQIPLTPPGSIVNPTGIAVDFNGDILVTQSGAGSAKVVRVNPNGGWPVGDTALSGHILGDPRGIDVARWPGYIYVSASFPGIAASRVYRYDRKTDDARSMGNTSTEIIFGLDVAPNGRVYAAGGSYGGTPVIFVFDFVAGSIQIATSGQYLNEPNDVAVEYTGDYAVADGPDLIGWGGIIQVDASFGSQQAIEQAGWDFSGIDVGFDGNYVVVGPQYPAVFRVDATTGVLRTVSFYDFLVQPTAIAVAPTPRFRLMWPRFPTLPRWPLYPR